MTGKERATFSFSTNDRFIIAALRACSRHGRVRSRVIEAALRQWSVEWDHENNPHISPVPVAAIASNPRFIEAGEWEETECGEWQCAEFVCQKHEYPKSSDFGLHTSDFDWEVVDDLTDRTKLIRIYVSKRPEREQAEIEHMESMAGEKPVQSTRVGG